jgi:hypothetical protein
VPPSADDLTETDEAKSEKKLKDRKTGGTKTTTRGSSDTAVDVQQVVEPQHAEQRKVGDGDGNSNGSGYE